MNAIGHKRCSLCSSYRLFSSSVQWISALHYYQSSNSPRPDAPIEIDGTAEQVRRKRKYISHESAVSLIKREKDAKRALEIFNKVSDQKGFNHNNSTYAVLLHRLAVCKKFEKVDAVIHQMKYETCKFNEGVFTNLMKHYSKSSFHEKVVEMFDAILPIVRDKPSLNAISTCLNLLIEAKQIELAKEFLLNVQKRLDLKPNTCIFNIMVKYHCRTGDVEAAFEVLEEMRKSRVSHPNLITYSTLMDGLCRCGRLLEAIDLFEKMLAEDQIPPDALTYNILINAFCRAGKVDRARKIIEFMRKNGCQPNIVNYTALMNGFCREGRVGNAKEIFHEMKGVGLTPDVVGYTTLINSFCRAGKVDEGIELLEEMKDQGCKADDVTVKIILGGLCRASRSSEAFDMLERLPYDGVRLSKESYRIVLNFLCKEGELEKAMELLGLMLARRFVPHFAMSNELLVQLCEAGKAADAALALFGLLEMGFKPEPKTWSMLIDVICRERKLLPAFQLLDELVLQ